jgi:hypothetical protein
VGSPTSVAKLKPNEILKKMQEEVAQRQRHRAYQVNMYMNNCHPENRDIEKMLTKNRSDNHLVSTRVIENLRNQESPDLELRVEARRRRSGTPGSKGFNRTFSINSTKLAKIDQFQTEIESVIEKCSQERDSKIKEIKKKYKEEIKQMKLLGGTEGIISKVLDEIKVNMKSEIAEIEKNIREKKKGMIEEIKSNYY